MPDNGLKWPSASPWARRARRRPLNLVVAVLALAACAPVTSAQAQPGDTTVLSDGFENGLVNWTPTVRNLGVAEIQDGIGTNGSKGMRLIVPDYTSSSIAFIKHTLATPAYGLSASGRFKVNSGGCSDTAGYSAGNVPFLRFFDANGRRIAGLYRINGSCSKTAKLFVQHSGNFYRTGKNISFGSVYSAELRIAVSEPSKSLVQIYLNGDKVYESTIADNGLRPVASVNIHNEHPDQVGDLVADDITIASFPVTPPTNPCNAATPAPSTPDAGTTILADNFESFEFGLWTEVNRAGDGTASVQTATVKTGNCAALLSVTSNASSQANLSKSTPAGTGTVRADGWFNVVAQGANTSSNVPFLRLFSGTSRIVDVYRVNGSGQLYMRTLNGSTTTFTSLGRTIALNTWYNLKVHADASGSASTVQVWLNGIALRQSTGTALSTSAINSVMIGSEHLAQEGKLAADDVVIKTDP